MEGAKLRQAARDINGLTIAVRADASLAIGTGHVMRCLTLAEYLRSHGAVVRFVMRPMPGSLEEFVRSRGYEVACLTPRQQGNGDADPDDYQDWLGVTPEHDAIETVSALVQSGGLVDCLIVDHYGLDAKWEKLVRKQAGMVAVIDDLANRSHDCELLLDANFTNRAEARYSGLVPEGCRLLLGPAYSLLRDEFREARSALSRGSGRLSRVLVFLGGVDRPNLTAKALEGTLRAAEGDVEIDVVAGGSNPHYEHLAEVCHMHDQVSFHRSVENMAAHMVAADLAIGGGGTTTWERCALGLPALIAALAENQVAIGEEAARYGVAEYLGHACDITVDQIAEAVSRLKREPHRLTTMSRHALALVDGRGVERVATAIYTCCPGRVSA